MTRTHQWPCDACRHWQKKHPQGNCTATSMRMTVQQAREDRILHELHASGGDLRLICDMFGLSISGANRYPLQSWLIQAQ